MKIAGIIAEYNPFHTGHARHIALTRKTTGCDAVICAMSASFVQRGQNACYDKFARTRAALMSGADMVLELPSAVSLQSAEFFADGAVRLLEGCRIVDYLSYGAEVPSPLLQESEGLRERLDSGMSYAAALDNPLPPNAMLGSEYRRAINLCGGSMIPVEIPRCNDNCKTAGELRSMLPFGKGTEYLPVAQGDFLSFDRFLVPFLLSLRSLSADSLRNISQVSEGLEYRILNSVNERSMEALILACKSKRYTYSRISRILCCAFLGITKDITHAVNTEIPYIRVLGVRKQSLWILSELTRRAALPVITNTADAMRAGNPLLTLEIKATDLRAAVALSPAGTDYTAGLTVI